jgi:selenocysteine lyase/cysteine desulfurase
LSGTSKRRGDALEPSSVHHRRGTRERKDPKLSYRGLRVTPNIYTPLEEIDTFVEAMQNVVKNGLPA